MATKWTGTYTPIANVNNGNEFGDGDVITTEMANVPINNAEYAVQVANQAKEKAEQAYNQSKSEPIIIYEDSLMIGVKSYQLDSSGLYHVEFVNSVDSLDRVLSGEITFYYDSNRLGNGRLNTQYSFDDGTIIIVSCTSLGNLQLLTESNASKSIIKIIKII